MTQDEPAEATGAELVGRYEQLRAKALAGDVDGWRLGAAVLNRRGLAAWIACWDHISCVRVPAAATSEPQPCDSQLVDLLASMALACLRG